MSAHFNDTLHDGDELDINTTLSTLASTTIPVSKDCILEMTENEISQIVELFNSNLVNVVVIPISFSNSSHEGQLFSDFNVLLSNHIGREILYALARWHFRYFPWTLKVGIGNFKLNVNGSQNDCTKTGKNASDFALESTQHIVDSINLATNYQVCSSFKETSSGKVKKTCCQMMKPYLATKFNYKCPKENSFLFGSDLLWRVIFLIMLLLALFYLIWLSLVFVSRTEFVLNYPEYYKLEESLMSPSSILLKVIWDENGLMVSFIRRLVLVGVCSYSFYLFSWRTVIVRIIAQFLYIFWALSFLVWELISPKSTNSALILNRLKLARSRVSRFFQLFCYISAGKRGDFEVVVEIILLTVNPNVWRNIINTLYNKCATFARCVTRRFRNRILKTLALCAYSVLAVLICFVYVCILFCFRIVIATFCPLFLSSWLNLLVSIEHRDNGTVFAYAFGLYFFMFFIAITVIPSILSFLLGLFLNLIYFIPYFAFFSVLTFYCCSYWKTMEEKYFVLKRLIYEECRETQNINNGCIPNGHPKPNEKVLPVVSKELYDKIREELLPYDTNLFYFGLKMFWSIAFSLVIFALINMLNESNVTGLVQVMTTASLGVLPHIFNMVGLKTNEERKKAENEKLKSNVKFMVKELIGKDPKLARRLLIIEQDDDVIKENNNTAKDDENADSEYFETMFGIDFSDNDEIGSARTATLGGNDETADENGQNSKNAYDNVDSEDGQLDEIVHRNREAFIDDDDGDVNCEEQPLVQQNNDVVVEQNHQNSGNAYDNVDSDDGKLAVIVHRNREAMTEDSEEEPLLQQNNDVMVEENYQNSGNTHDNVDGDDGQLAVIVHRNRKTMIDDTEDPEEQLLVQQNNDVIVEENHQNSGNTHDNVDGDDGQLAVIVHRNHETIIDDSEEQPSVQQNNDVIVEENHQNSGNTYGNVDGDDGKLAVIVHRNHETIIDDSKEQSLVQQNNDVIVKENHQNSGNTHDNVDGDDGQLAVIVHRNHETIIDDSKEQSLVQQNNDVIVKENHQNSGNTHDNVDGDDGKLAVIVHRNHETIIDDSKEQSLVQQNNDVIVKENHQNSGNTHDNVDGDDGQ